MVVVPTDEERLFAGKPLVAYLSTTHNDRPHVTPISYYYQDEQLYMITRGKKVENIRKNPKVAVAIQQDTDGLAEWMVQLKGTATIHDDPEIIKEKAKNIYKKYFGEDMEEWDDLRHEMISNPSGEVTLLQIEIGSVISKRY